MSRPLLADRAFRPLFLAQLLSALGDNLLRNAIALLALWSSSGIPGWLVAAAAGAFVAPTVLLSGLGGELADRMDKARLVRTLKLLELPVAAVAAFGLVTGALPLVLAALAASGVIAALFGPVKYGILPELVGTARVPAANALVEAGTFAAILAGSVGGTLLIGGSAYANLPAAALVLAAAALSWLSARRLPALAPAAPDLPVRANLLASTWGLLRDLHRDRRSWRAALGNAWFWTLGAAVLSLLPGLSRDVLAAGPTTDAAFLGLFAIGVGCGSGAAAFLAGGRTLLAPAALGSALAGVALACVWRLTHGQAGPHAIPMVPLCIALFAAASGAGLIAVPTQAAVQAWAAPQRRARAVGGSNVLSALGMVAGSVLVAMAQRQGWSEPSLLGVAGLLALLLAPIMFLRLPANPLGEAVWMLFRVLYRVELRGAEYLPSTGQAALITPNHVSWLDAALVFALCDDKPLFAIDAEVARLWWVRPILHFVPALRVATASPHSLRTMVSAVRGGARLVVFPEGRISVTGSLMEVQDGTGTVADKSGAPVVPIHIQGLERTPFSRLTRQQTRRALFPQITATVLPPVRLDVPAEVTGRARRVALTAALRDAMEDAVYRTRETATTLFEAVGQAARAHGPGRLAIEDPVSGPLSYRRLLAGADVLGGLVSEGTQPGQAVGVLLPTSNASALCLLGLSSHGRVPAMLNATAGLAALRAAVTAAEIGKIVTSRAFVEKAKLGAVVEALARDVQVVFLEELRTQVTRAMKLRALVHATLRPGTPRVPRTADSPAVVMFTSGSSGTPKGVVLTHRNLLANVAQVSGRIGFGRADRVLNTLPMFHAFGLTGGFLLPVVSGVPAFLYPSPLHYAAIPQIAYGWNATAMFGTSTFLRGYARRAHPTAFRSLRLVVAGAERVQPAVRELWMERFGLRILEGFGATECSPVLAVNTPMSNRSGTVGRLLPGMAMRLEPVEGLDGAGRLFVSGPNVMAGYLRAEQPGLLQPPPGGWYDTGDIVSVGQDGHIAIVGRASRIAKPGGEMVSLAAVEDLAGALWPDVASVAVAVPDLRKGERVVLLTERRGATRAEYAAAARSRGVAEIALPAEVRVLDRVPLLGSGKPDFIAATALAASLAGDDARAAEAA